MSERWTSATGICQRTLSKAGFAANEVNDALAFQKLKNEIIASQNKWDEYAKARATVKDRKWFRHPGIDVRGPERRNDPFWTHMRRFYVYDPLPTLQTLRTLNLPLLALFGELDMPEAVKANVCAIRQILDQSGCRDYAVKVYPNGSHNLMEVPRDNTHEYVRRKRFPPGFFETMVDWTTIQLRRRPPARR